MQNDTNTTSTEIYKAIVSSSPIPLTATKRPNKRERAALNRANNQQQVNNLVSTLVQPTTTDSNTKTTLDPLKISFGAQNAARQEAREFKNVTHAAEGLLVIINEEDNTVTYGFQDLRVWVPRTQTWDLLTANDPDKFMVNAETHALASSEFYNRWRTFTQLAYKTRIFITAINR